MASLARCIKIGKAEQLLDIAPDVPKATVHLHRCSGHSGRVDGRGQRRCLGHGCDRKKVEAISSYAFNAHKVAVVGAKIHCEIEFFANITAVDGSVACIAQQALGVLEAEVCTRLLLDESVFLLNSNT